jgi:hypothetical protein
MPDPILAHVQEKITIRRAKRHANDATLPVGECVLGGIRHQLV